jgi:hypothetical protein
MRLPSLVRDYLDALRGRDAYSKPAVHNCMQWKVISAIYDRPNDWTRVQYRCTDSKCDKIRTFTIPGFMTKEQVEAAHATKRRTNEAG